VTDLVIRSLAAGDEHLFDAYDGPVFGGPIGRTYRELAGKNEYRPEWTWVALRDGAVIARAAWWAGPEDKEPEALDWLDLRDGDQDAAVALLEAAPYHCEYGLRLPPNWRADPELSDIARIRMDAVIAAGWKPLVERYWYRWTPARGLPARPGRLDYRPEPDDAVILDLLRRINEGSLDAHARRMIEKDGVDAAARDDLEILRWFPSPRDRWLVAYTPAGEPAGLTIPARNYSDPVVGLIGVVPEMRGNGYAYDLLVECTHRLVEAGADRVIAATDIANKPMAAAFARAGYPIVQERVFLL
jgi:RimJ/RimL family protein N-acetyltransferase